MKEIPKLKTSIVERQGITYLVNSTTPLTGIAGTYYENEQLEQKIQFKNGKREGLREVFHKNGQLMSTGNYKNGQRHGISKWFHKNGRLRSWSNYKKGKPTT